MTDGQSPTSTSSSGERSIAAGTSIGVAVSGDHAHVVVLPAEAVHWARTVQAPPEAGSLPWSASGVFVGRGVRRPGCSSAGVFVGRGARPPPPPGD
ncbi:hypothetical protein [Streptomyces dysideae]|uniref:Uncharacterized protein n=1 Tax=Streptomyces dysideae TaxID=909626 RepID=A0A124IEM4_9ACTN|nr:hypothetical protein AQJ91_23035 [Streptomyces dysideae]